MAWLGLLTSCYLDTQPKPAGERPPAVGDLAPAATRMDPADEPDAALIDPGPTRDASAPKPAMPMDTLDADAATPVEPTEEPAEEPAGSGPEMADADAEADAMDTPADAGEEDPTDPPDADGDDPAWSEWLARLARQNPQVRQADLLFSLAEAMANGPNPENLIALMDALDAFTCRNAQDLCTGVCQWARANCRACEGEGACRDAIADSCFFGCGSP